MSGQAFDKISFGVEIETTVPHGLSSIAVCDYHTRIPIPAHQCPGLAGWRAERDGSITGRNLACEFISPPLVGVAGVTQMDAGLAAIRGLGARVNPSCGLHIHVGLTSVPDGATLLNASNLRGFRRAFARIAIRHQWALYAAGGTKARQRGRWCRPYMAPAAGTLTPDGCISLSMMERYRVINLRPSAPTAEVRAFPATRNGKLVHAYLRMCTAMAKAASETADDNAQLIPPAPVGGVAAMADFFAWAGWDAPDAQVIGPRPLAETKSVLMKMAECYDTGKQPPSY